MYKVLSRYNSKMYCTFTIYTLFIVYKKKNYKKKKRLDAPMLRNLYIITCKLVHYTWCFCWMEQWGGILGLAVLSLQRFSVSWWCEIFYFVNILLGYTVIPTTDPSLLLISLSRHTDTAWGAHRLCSTRLGHQSTRLTFVTGHIMHDTCSAALLQKKQSFF